MASILIESFKAMLEVPLAERVFRIWGRKTDDHSYPLRVIDQTKEIGQARKYYFSETSYMIVGYRNLLL